MKNNLKKYLSLAMVMIFAIASIAAIPTTAADAVDPLDANLVIHYDFEGADILEAVKDKATAGANKDDIAPIAGTINFSGLNVDNVNGTITHTSSAAGIRADRSADTDTVGGEYTCFVRTKLSRGDEQQYFFIVEMRTFGSASIRPFAIQYDTKTQELCVCISEESTPNVAQNLRFPYAYDYTSGEYINIAVVVNKAEVEGQQVYQATLNVAKGLPKTAADWTALGTKTIGAGIAQPTDANKLNLLSNGSTGCALGVTYDDFRIYNKALTLDEIATIVPNGSFDGQLKEKPADTENTPADTDNTPADTGNTPADTNETPADTNGAADTGANDTAADTAEEKGGCGSTVATGAVAVIALAGTMIVSKKKKD